MTSMICCLFHLAVINVLQSNICEEVASIVISNFRHVVNIV